MRLLVQYYYSKCMDTNLIAQKCKFELEAAAASAAIYSLKILQKLTSIFNNTEIPMDVYMNVL